MNYQIVISGVGGQGVLFITGLIATTCMDKGLHVLTSETHGMAQRGGTVISHLKTGEYSSPLIRPGSADLLIVLKPENFLQHQGFLKKEGRAVVNSEFKPESSQGSQILHIDADGMAKEENNTDSVNIYMLGAALAITPICTLEDIKQQVELRFKGKNRAITSVALSALEKGFNGIRQTYQCL